MKITGIESRVIGYDIAEAWGGIMPEAIHSTWYEYSFDVIHTDEGIDGYTMQNANVRDGGAMVHVLHDLYAPQILTAATEPERIRKPRRDQFGMRAGSAAIASRAPGSRPISHASV